jgi:hypothetical protein
LFLVNKCDQDLFVEWVNDSSRVDNCRPRANGEASCGALVRAGKRDLNTGLDGRVRLAACPFPGPTASKGWVQRGRYSCE